MKLIIPIIVFSLMLISGCDRKQDNQDGKNSSMHLDSLYQDDKNVTVLKDKDKIILSEEMENFEDNPGISGMDLDVINKIAGKDMQLVNKGDKIILSEKPTSTK